MSDLIKRLRSIRGNFVIPTDSPPIFKWADEAADALERIQDTFCVWEDCDQEASYSIWKKKFTGHWGMFSLLQFH